MPFAASLELIRCFVHFFIIREVGRSGYCSESCGLIYSRQRAVCSGRAAAARRGRAAAARRGRAVRSESPSTAASDLLFCCFPLINNIAASLYWFLFG